MSVRLALAGDTGTVRAGEAETAAFLGRLLRWDKAAVVRLRSAPGEPALGVFGQPPFGGVLAVKSMALSGPGVDGQVDATVSAGELLEAVATAVDGGEFTVPGSVTGPAWAGLLPPRSHWRRDAELDAALVREAAARTVAEFRARTEALVPEQRTRAGLDALAEELWRRPLTHTGGGGTEVPLRVVHAAHALGFLRPGPPAGDPAAARERDSQGARGPEGSPRSPDTVAVLTAGPWLRLRTAYGSVAMRVASAASGLTVSPL
ncbi:hypothetical protein V2S66_08800 [Streptomyces sp. V4-01]|uniref:Uncharacterized protein n=1 Tax=Actinacidiphila polyblastidii TaxID=3110430 RepID=A0ABU7P8C4_9ACTN|nr:hypothetical protein [Streptomyces sp. V4-01]